MSRPLSVFFPDATVDAIEGVGAGFDAQFAASAATLAAAEYRYKYVTFAELAGWSVSCSG